MKRHILLLGLLLVCVFGVQARETYCFAQRDTALHMDLYRPAAEPNGYTLLHVFGGGFISGARTNPWDTAYCHKMASEGYTVAAIDYRLGLRGVKKVGVGNITALENAFYMAVEDCSSAIRYLVEHAGELSIDADKIILEGSSAGAITALMTDFARCNSLACAGELPEDWQPAGVVAYSGAIYSKDGALKWVKEPAPTLLFHGMVDKIVPYKQITFGHRGLFGANAIAKRMEKFDYPYCIYRLLGLGHEVSVGGPVTTDELNLFVQQYLHDKRKLYKDITYRDAAVKPGKFTYLTLKDIYKSNKK